jgi:Fic family protein
MQEIDDLINAYNFAVQHPLNQKNFQETHKLLSRAILSVKKQRGVLRNQPIGIFSAGKLEYLAVEPHLVKQEFLKLFHDIETLLKTDLSYNEILYYASMMHLIFEKMHPFNDGNGRAGRLLEKWFLASKVGENAWALKSEQYYAEHRPQYYKNIHIGVNYYELNMDKCFPFLLMLPESLKTQF